MVVDPFDMELMFGIARNFDHRGAQQAIFQLVAALQFFEYLMIFGVGGFNHLDGFMEVGIEGLALGRNGAQTQLLQCILQLLVDEFDSAAKLGFLRALICSARSKLSSEGSRALIASAMAYSRKSCCSRAVRLRAFSNSA